MTRPAGTSRDKSGAGPASAAFPPRGTLHSSDPAGAGPAEDLAAVAVVVAIAVSAIVAAGVAIERLLHPRDVTNLAPVAAAALAGFAGNQLVARYRIRVGRKIGSAALVADGLHARTDGFTSLAVLIGAGGVALGWQWAHPVLGLGITAAIVVVCRQATREVYRRLMDAVDPALVDRAETTRRPPPSVLAAGRVPLRGIARPLRAECEVVVDAGCSAVQAHQVAAEAEHALIHTLPRLTAPRVHADPKPHDAFEV